MTGRSSLCERIDAALEESIAGSREPLAPELAGHLEHCSRCKTLYRLIATELIPAFVPRTLEAAVVSAITSSLTPVSPIASSIQSTIAIVGAMIALGTIGVVWMRPAGATAMSIAQLVLMSVVLIVGLALAARALALQMRPGSLGWFSGKQPIFFQGLSFALLTGLLFPWSMMDHYGARGIHCLFTGLILAVPASAIIIVVIRRGALLNGFLTGATVGAVAGWIALGILQYSCEYQNVGHLLVWHGAVLLATTSIGALLGEGLARARRPAR